MVLAFAAWRITASDTPAQSTPGQATVVGPDGKEQPASASAPAPPGPGGPIPTIADNLVIEVPAYNPITVVSPFRTVLPTPGDHENHFVPPTPVGPLPTGIEITKPGLTVEKDKPQFVLQGILSGNGAPMAMIGDGDKPVRIVWRGAILSDGSRVVEIHSNRVVLEKGRTRSTLVMQSP